MTDLYDLICLLHGKKNFDGVILSKHIYDHGIPINCNLINSPYTRLSKVLSRHEAVGVSLFNKLHVSVQHLYISGFKKGLFSSLVERPF